MQAVHNVIKISNFQVDHVFARLTSILHLQASALAVDWLLRDAHHARPILCRLSQPAQHVILLVDIFLMVLFVQNVLNIAVSVLTLLHVHTVKHPPLTSLFIMENVYAI
jgi:hypothetical protein